MSIEKKFVLISEEKSIEKLKSYFSEGFFIFKKEYLGKDIEGRCSQIITLRKNFLTEA